MSVVVDASLIVALVVADERQSAVVAHFERWIEVGASLHAPAVLPYEVANVVARLTLDGKLPVADMADTWSDVAAIDLTVHPFDLASDGPAVAAITKQLRRRHATDATYIRVAMQPDATMWTLDGPLARNAADVGLPVYYAAGIPAGRPSSPN